MTYDRLWRLVGQARLHVTQAVLLECGNHALRGATRLAVFDHFLVGDAATFELLYAFKMHSDRLLRIEVDVLESFHETFHKVLGDLRAPFDRGAFAGHGDAQRLYAVVRIQNAVDLHALRPHGRRKAAEQVSYGFHLSVDQRGVQCRAVHGDLLDLLVVDARGFDERRPELKVAASDVEADCLTFEILGLEDIVFFHGKNPDRRNRPDSGHGDEVQPTPRAGHHDREIDKAEIVLPLIDRHASPPRTKAAIDRDIEPSLVPKAHRLGHKCETVGAERQPRQSELYWRGRPRDPGGGNPRCAGGAGCSSQRHE